VRGVVHGVWYCMVLHGGTAGYCTSSSRSSGSSTASSRARRARRPRCCRSAAARGTCPNSHLLLQHQHLLASRARISRLHRHQHRRGERQGDGDRAGRARRSRVRWSGLRRFLSMPGAFAARLRTLPAALLSGHARRSCGRVLPPHRAPRRRPGTVRKAATARDASARAPKSCSAALALFHSVTVLVCILRAPLENLTATRRLY